MPPPRCLPSFSVNLFFQLASTHNRVGNETGDFLNNSTILFTSDEEAQIDKLDNSDIKLISQLEDNSTSTAENEDKVTSKKIGFNNKEVTSGKASQVESLLVKALQNI